MKTIEVTASSKFVFIKAARPPTEKLLVTLRCTPLSTMVDVPTSRSVDCMLVSIG